MNIKQIKYELQNLISGESGASYDASFRERAAQAMMRLSKQSPVTLEAAREQVQWLKKNTKTKHKKQRS